MSKTTNNTGLDFATVLCIAFIVLKLTGYIKWSWWWVMSPIWIPLALFLFIYLIILLIKWLYNE